MPSFPVDGVKSDVANALKYAKSKGAEKFSIVGFCWGAWVVYEMC